MPQCRCGGEGAPRSPSFLACPAAKALVTLPPTTVIQPCRQQEAPDFPPLLRDVPQPWVGKGPRRCSHKATLWGHGATRPQRSLHGHRVSLEPPTCAPCSGASPSLPHSCHPPLQQEFGVLSSSPSPTQQCSSQGWRCSSGHQEDTSLSPPWWQPLRVGYSGPAQAGQVSPSPPPRQGTSVGSRGEGRRDVFFRFVLFWGFGVFCLFPLGQF